MQDTQIAAVKATAAFAQISDIMPKAKREDDAIKTKKFLSSAQACVLFLLLECVYHLFNNVCRKRMKPTFKSTVAIYL